VEEAQLVVVGGCCWKSSAAAGAGRWKSTGRRFVQDAEMLAIIDDS
jgi:hypothetical protein